MANKGNVTVGKPLVAGAVYRAPVGVPLPTSADEELLENFYPVGYISDEGLRWSYSGDGDVIRAWGRDVVARPAGVVDDVASFQMLETVDEEAVKAFWGDDAWSLIRGGYALQVGVPSPVQYSWVIDMLLPTKPDPAIIWPSPRVRRIVIPMASVREREEIVYQDSELVAYGLSLRAAKDSSGKYHYEYDMGPVMSIVDVEPDSDVVHTTDTITLTIETMTTSLNVSLYKLVNGSWQHVKLTRYSKPAGSTEPYTVYLPEPEHTFEEYGVGVYQGVAQAGKSVVYQFEVIE